MAKYLELKEHGVESIEHADKFYEWLKAAGTAHGQRAGVVKSIAEKLNVTIPGIYNDDLYLPLPDKVDGDANAAAAADDAVDGDANAAAAADDAWLVDGDDDDTDNA